MLDQLHNIFRGFAVPQALEGRPALDVFH